MCSLGFGLVFNLKKGGRPVGRGRLGRVASLTAIIVQCYLTEGLILRVNRDPRAEPVHGNPVLI